MKILITLCIVAVALAAVDKDIVSKVPGYPEDFNTSVYSGYLTLGSPNRGIHYVFVESQKGKGNKDPVTLWMNGGPGCSSMLGFLQEIGPYYLQEGVNYNRGDNLTFNPYSWHNVSNLLFFESPTQVGFSYNNEAGYKHNDHNTCQDNFDALKDFFTKYPEYLPNAFWIAGQSYAGKYIPDLAVKIDQFNQGAGASAINFKGILVGNGVMSFEDGSLQSSSAEYMIDHQFVDPEILQYWKTSCQWDHHSAGCRFFHKRLEENVEQINPYNVYSYCFYNTTTSGVNGFAHESQESMLYKMMAKAKKEQKPRFNGAPCSYFDGVFNYFSLNSAEFHAKDSGMKWLGPCNGDIDYTIDLSGSIPEYRILLARLSQVKYQIVLYSGDWDDVVPYHDTIKGIKSLYLHESYIYHPWFTGDQHSGFSQLYNGILFLTVKGASHQVPQSKRAEAFEMFSNVLDGHVESHPGFGVKEE